MAQGNHSGEIKVLYVQPKIQFSKLITAVILTIITATWAIGLYKYWNEVNLYSYLMDYVSTVSLGVLPYFCLSAVDRFNYAMQAKYQCRNENCDE